MFILVTTLFRIKMIEQHNPYIIFKVTDENIGINDLKVLVV